MAAAVVAEAAMAVAVAAAAVAIVIDPIHSTEKHKGPGDFGRGRFFALSLDCKIATGSAVRQLAHFADHCAPCPSGGAYRFGVDRDCRFAVGLRLKFVGWYASHAPYDSEPLQKPDRSKCSVDLPPEESRLGCVRVVVVVVMPSFTHANEREQEAVATVIRRVVASRTDQMAQRIHDRRHVEAEQRANAEADA